MRQIIIGTVAVIALGAVIAVAQNQTNPAIVGATGAYNSSPPTCTNGNWCSLQTDINGALKVTGGSAPTSTPVTSVTNVTPINCSGTITAGGTAQNAFTAQSGLHGFIIMNLSNNPMGISFNGTAVLGAAGTYTLNAGSSTTAGGSFSTPLGFGMNTALSVVSATTADAYSCTRW